MCYDCVRIECSPSGVSCGTTDNFKYFEMGFIKWRCAHYYCYFWEAHYRLLQPSLALVKSSQQSLCLFSAWPSFTLGSYSPKSLPAPHGIFQGSKHCSCLRRAATQQQENTRWIMKADTYSVSSSRGSHKLGLGNARAAFILFVLWRQMKKCCRARKQLDHSKLKIKRQ